MWVLQSGTAAEATLNPAGIAFPCDCELLCSAHGYFAHKAMSIVSTAAEISKDDTAVD